MKVYYPAVIEKHSGRIEKEALLSEEEVRKGLTDFFGVPNFLLSHIKLIQTHIYKGIPFAGGSFPVIIFRYLPCFEFKLLTVKVMVMEESILTIQSCVQSWQVMDL